MKKNKRRLVYAATLKKELKFTDRALKKLGKPNKECANPHYKSGPPSKLYYFDRAEKFKLRNPDLFADAHIKSKRIIAAQKAVETKHDNLLDEIATTTVTFHKPLPAKFRTLEQIALGHAIGRYGANYRTPGLNGIISTVRHNYTNYEELLSMIRGRVGTGEAYELIRQKMDDQIFSALTAAYPNECEE